MPCEIVIPAAREQQITVENAGRLHCEVVVEAANGPTTPEAETILRERGILVVPDVLANAGGVTVSYFEWVQDHQRYTWDELDIQERLRRQLRAAFGARHRRRRPPGLRLAHGRAVGGDRARRRGRADARHLPVVRGPRMPPHAALAASRF